MILESFVSAVKKYTCVWNTDTCLRRIMYNKCHFWPTCQIGVHINIMSPIQTIQNRDENVRIRNLSALQLCDILGKTKWKWTRNVLINWKRAKKYFCKLNSSENAFKNQNYKIQLILVVQILGSSNHKIPYQYNYISCLVVSYKYNFTWYWKIITYWNPREYHEI